MRTPKSILIWLILTLAAAPLAGAATLKLATLSPDGSYWMERMRQGAAEVAEKTDGRVKIKIYPGGVMGDDKAVLQKMRMGQLHGGAMIVGSLSDYYTDAQIYSLPLVFRSVEEVDHVRQEMDPILLAGMEKGGFVAFGLAEGGFAYIMSKAPVTGVDDLRARKVWVPDNDPSLAEAVKAFDVSPIPLSIADVLAGLQTGLIDTVATPPIGAVALQWHTQVDHLMDVPFLYIYAALGVDKRAFSRLSARDQATVRGVMGEAFADIDRRNRKDNVAALGALKGQGIAFQEPPPGEMERWRKIAAKVPDRLVSAGRLSPEMVDRLIRLVSEYRSAQEE